MKRIDRVDVRAKLELRRDPYWYRLTNGRYLGFRRMTKGKPGTWLARFYDGEKYLYPQDGITGEDGADIATLPEGEQFDAAKRAAEKFFAHLEAGGTPKSITVKAACEAYVDERRLNNSEASAQDAKGRFKRLVYDDPIARAALQKLTPRHFADWKKRVLAKGGARISFNRNIAMLKAALNLAYRRNEVASDRAWREELKPFKNAENRRKLTLDAAERRRLIEECSDEARAFVKGLNLLPLRPGELAALRVEHLNARERELHIPTGKTKARSVPLSGEALAHFAECAKNKTPAAWLVARANGDQWKKEAWRDEIKLAAAAAKLPKATVAYTLRHSLITDLLTAGLDTLTVAKLAGTSLLMIEKHYGHLKLDHARKALEKLALA